MIVSERDVSMQQAESEIVSSITKILFAHRLTCAEACSVVASAASFVVKQMARDLIDFERRRPAEDNKKNPT